MTQRFYFELSGSLDGLLILLHLHVRWNVNPRGWARRARSFEVGHLRNLGEPRVFYVWIGRRIVEADEAEVITDGQRR